MIRSLKNRPNLTAALLLLLISAVLFLPYLVQPNTLTWPRSELGTDILAYNWPPVYFFRESLQKYNQIPLWQGTTMGGLPMIGNPAIRVFYPPQFLISLLPIPIMWGYALLNVFHFWLAGIGGYGLARWVMKLGNPASFLAGLLVMLTARLSSNVVGDVGYTHGMCWIPLFLLWAFLALDHASWRWAIAAGLALCCVYLGNVLYLPYVVWVLGLYFLYRCAELLKNRQSFRLVVQQLGILALILVFGLGFSAYQSFPFASYLPYQSRQAMTLADANYLALPPAWLINFVFPFAQKFPEWEMYVGLLPLMLAPLAFRYGSRRQVAWWSGLSIFAILYALGSITPIYTLMFEYIPGFRLLRAPARMGYFAAIALAMLAALAVDGILRAGKLSPRQWRWLWSSALGLALFTIAGRFLTRRPDELDWLLGIAASVGIVVALVCLHRWQQGRLSGFALAMIICGAVLLDLFPVDMGFGTPRPITDFTQPRPIVETMMQQAGDVPYRVYAVRREIPDAVAAAHDLESADGLTSFQFTSYSQFMRTAAGCDLEGIAAAVPACASNEISETAYLTEQPNPALLGLLNIRYIISPVVLANASLKDMAADDNLHLYENSAAFPRAFIIGHAEVVNGDGLSPLTQINPQSVALLDSDQPVDFPLPNNDFFGAGDITRYTPNEITVEANMPDSGLLVLGDPWTPGWLSDVDGHSASVLRVDGALRGVYLEQGAHTVTFYFRPTAFVVGLIVSILTVLIGAVVLVFSVRRKEIE